MTNSKVVQAYVLQIRAPIVSEIPPDIGAFLREMEENLTSLLPEGWSAHVVRWDAKENE